MTSTAGPHYSYIPTELEQANWRKEQAHVLEEFVEQARAKRQDLHAKAILISGDPRDELVAYAEKEGAVAIIIGSRGRGALKRAFLGSTSSYLVSHSPVPVTVIRAKETPKEA